MKKESVFITGGAGFIGANLAKFLLDKGCSLITVYDNLYPGFQEVEFFPEKSQYCSPPCGAYKGNRVS
jgi:nucleoside-diphosphate-sugar epimerase